MRINRLIKPYGWRVETRLEREDRELQEAIEAGHNLMPEYESCTVGEFIDKIKVIHRGPRY